MHRNKQAVWSKHMGTPGACRSFEKDSIAEECEQSVLNCKLGPFAANVIVLSTSAFQAEKTRSWWPVSAFSRRLWYLDTLDFSGYSGHSQPKGPPVRAMIS